MLCTLVSLGSVPLFRSKAEAKVAEAGYDPARLPPGQYLTEKWPVLHAGSVPDVDRATWSLTCRARSSSRLTLTWEQLAELPSREVTVDIHCVTRWSRFDTTFKGVHWSELAKLAGPKPERPLRRRARRAGLHRQHAARGDRGRERADRLRGRRRAAHAGPRRPVRLMVPVALLLEEREVADRDSSSSTTTSPGSGSATATTTTRTSRRNSATRSEWVVRAAGAARTGLQ